MSSCMGKHTFWPRKQSQKNYSCVHLFENRSSLELIQGWQLLPEESELCSTNSQRIQQDECCVAEILKERREPPNRGGRSLALAQVQKGVIRISGTFGQCPHADEQGISRRVLSLSTFVSLDRRVIVKAITGRAGKLTAAERSTM